eukprot:1551904-Pyramimonas_sp.AAC.1
MSCMDDMVTYERRCVRHCDRTATDRREGHDGPQAQALRRKGAAPTQAALLWLHYCDCTTVTAPLWLHYCDCTTLVGTVAPPRPASPLDVGTASTA